MTNKVIHPKLVILFFLFWLGSLFAQDLEHRTSAHLGGIYYIMGYGISAGAAYEWAFHRNLALEIDGNYNFSLMAMGPGPKYSGGLDFSIETMLYNFGKNIFSKGFGLTLGIGTHFLVNFNKNMFKSKKGTYFLLPGNIGIFYYHLFDNNWFLKIGLKGYFELASYQLEGPKTESAPKILPKAFFALGYAF